MVLECFAKFYVTLANIVCGHYQRQNVLANWLFTVWCCGSKSNSCVYKVANVILLLKLVLGFCIYRKTHLTSNSRRTLNSWLASFLAILANNLSPLSRALAVWKRYVVNRNYFTSNYWSCSLLFG
jgi:hypothetical protein